MDTTHALVDPDASSRELFYVAMTRGKHRNHAYVIVPDPHEIEAHLDQPEPLTVTDRLAKVLARTDADLSATETLKLEVDRHASLSTLLAEYDVLAREAQTDRWAALLDVAPFPGNVADDVFTSAYYERLEAALARHEAAGHLAAAALNALAPRLATGNDQSDPAAQLATMLDQATSQLPPGKNRRRRVAGLIATPAQPMSEDMQTVLDERQALIEAAARRALHHALDAGEGWTKRIGRPPVTGRTHTAWLAHATTIALYRQRHGVEGVSPLGNPKDITNAQQNAEYRIASAAWRLAQSAGESFVEAPHRATQRTRPARGM